MFQTLKLMRKTFEGMGCKRDTRLANECYPWLFSKKRYQPAAGEVLVSGNGVEGLAAGTGIEYPKAVQ